MKPRADPLRRSMKLIKLYPDRWGRGEREKEQKIQVSGMRDDTKKLNFLLKYLPQGMLPIQMALLVE